MVYEVGMKLKVKSTLEEGDCEYGICDGMRSFRGMTVTVTRIEGDAIYIKEDQGRWVWSPDCFVVEVGDLNMETLMNKQSNFEISEIKREKLVNQMSSLLSNFHYENTPEALNKIIDEWARQKGWIVELFRKHSGYNGNGQVILPAQLKRPVDREAIYNSLCFFLDEYRKKSAKENEIHIGLFTLSEYKEAYENTHRIYHGMLRNSIYRGLTEAEWGRENDRMWTKYAKTLKESDATELCCGFESYYVPRKTYNDVENFDSMLKTALMYYSDWNEEANIFGEERVRRINKYAERIGLNTRAVVGQRVNKWFGKVAKETGLNKIIRIQTDIWRDDDGNEYQREKDYGYNYYFAKLGDAINPLEYEREVVVSVNPIDYYTMSFGYNWASCHTIDKENIRQNGNDNYSGCYSGGTESYMLDPSSIVVYVRPTESEIKKIHEDSLPLEEQSKLKRCIFYLGEDKLVQSRVYPDGRDGGDEGLAAQLRAIMQKTISELYQTPNMWTLKKGTNECRKAIYTVESVHYTDYTHYDDCNVSYLRRIDGILNENKINVGAKIICPDCGCLHRESEHITCDSCYEVSYCCVCGERVRRDGIYIDGRPYCSEHCAREDGYVNTADCGWQERDYCQYDNCTEEWYYETDGGIYVDDYWFHDEESARDYGYRYSQYDQEWYSEDDVHTLVDGRTFSITENCNAIETERGWYISVEDALEDGWELDANGNLVAA